jgi:hypothetical protein
MSSLHRSADVAAAVKARVAQCTIALGAETDLGVSVYQGRRHVDDTMIPCCTLIEGEDTPARGRVRDEYEITQRYVLYAYLPCSAADPNLAAHAGIRDLKRTFFLTDGKPDVTFSGQVRLVEYMGKDIGPRADGAAFVVAAVEIAVTFVERLSAP